MAYTSPVFTAVAGGTILAAQHNTYVRDNLAAVWVGTTAGDIDYYTSATAKSRLGIGSAYQQLRTNAGATAPAWGGAIAARVTRSTAQTIGNASYTDISFDAAGLDTNSFWAIGSPTVLTIPITGKYIFGATLSYDSNATGSRETRLITSEAGKASFDSRVAVNGAATFTAMVGFAELTAAATVLLRVWQNSGGNLNISAATAQLWIAFQGA